MKISELITKLTELKKGHGDYAINIVISQVTDEFAPICSEISVISFFDHSKFSGSIDHKLFTIEGKA